MADLNTIINFRKHLHEYPELSGKEEQTAQKVKEFLQENYPPTEIIEKVGGHGLIAIYSFSEDGPKIMIRCELDALPIHEKKSFIYSSKNEGVSHKCGHDGHMAIVAGLASFLVSSTITKGKVALLFQPAEETGQGAQAVCNNYKFQNIKPDFILALHNIPGQDLHCICILKDYFSATVQSFSIQFMGKISHAAEPENGNNPALAMAKVINALSEIQHPNPHDSSYVVLTPVFINMGEKNYGISPGEGELHYTVRTWGAKNMERAEEEIKSIVSRISKEFELEHNIDWFEYFPSAENDPYLNDVLRNAVQKLKLETKEMEYPFRFGEDFGWYSKTVKCCMFGLGAGLNTPTLHHEDYDFPDSIIETGLSAFKEVITEILK